MRLILIFTLILLVSCNNLEYQNQEFNAIEDIANDYLKQKHFKKVTRKPPPPGDIMFEEESYVDTTDLKVFVSDALLPIDQVKEDNYWMFDELYSNKELDSLFNELQKEERFAKLKYREFIKTDLNIKKPYKQIFNIKKEVVTDEEYVIFSFSRILFDSDFKKGIVVIDFNYGSEYGIMGGFHRPYLIKKLNDKWTFVDE